MILMSLSERYIPTCIIVNEENEVVHTLGPVEEFLRVPRGEMNFNLSRMLQVEYASVLRTAIHNVLQHKKELIYDFSSLDIRENKSKIIKSHVFPLFPETIEPQLIAITFESQENFNIEAYKKVDVNADFTQHVNDLEKELQYTRENLQAAIEELETSNEELQATNEELLAANEELQSTNEELQSVNEELVTVNSEYQYKIEELVDVNNDINNLLSGSHVGILFLDADLRIKRFTPNITNELYLMEFDIGRPIQHISHNLKYDSFISEIKMVIRKQEKYEREIESKSNRWYTLRLMPYLTTENQVQGVMITLSDITEQRKERQSQLFLAAIAAALDDAIIGQNLDGLIISWNQAASKIFGYAPNDVLNQPIDILVPHELRKENDALSKKAFLGEMTKQFNTVRLGRNGHLVSVKIDILPIADENKIYIGCSWIIRLPQPQVIIPQKINTEADHQLAYQLLENSVAAVLVVSPEGVISFVNQQAEEIFEKSKEDLIDTHYEQLPWVVSEGTDDSLEKSADVSELLNDPQPFYNQHRLLLCQNKKILHLRVNGAPLLDKNGKIYSIIFSLVECTEKKS
jgi:two-component system, chemotaxis family, CheB/CheR fusion protein